MPERHVLKHQIPSLAKRGYDLSEYKPEIRFHHASAWFFIVKKSSEFNADEYLVGTGLISEPPRNKSGHRQYSHEAVKRTDFIKRCQTLGFSLKEIEEILELRITPESTCADMKSRVTEKLIDVDKKINELVQIRDALSRLQNKCTGKGPIGNCPILEELYQ
jgi:MerR family mercuric resistance operon transcriptional regulator